MDGPAISLRPATAGDAVTLAALATHVFMDTYVTEAVFPHLAEEAMSEYSVEAFTARMQEPARRFILAEVAGGLIGFAEIEVAPLAAPAGNVTGAELVRLYVQPKAQRAGVGKVLIEAAERLAAEQSLGALWLTAWEHNQRALAFYARLGYEDLGAGTYTFRGRAYGTRVLAKALP